MQTLLRCIAIIFALVGAQISTAQELNVPGQLLAEVDAPAPGSNITLAFLSNPRPVGTAIGKIRVMPGLACNWNGNFRQA